MVGSPRGGTSMIAGIVRKLGVFMGEDLDEANNEDREFLTHRGRRAIFWKPENAEEKAAYLDKAIEVVGMRNGSHDIWGWKDPISSFYLGDLLPQLRNPVFIFVTRDPGAIAQRERIEEDGAARRAPLDYIKVASNSYVQIVEMLAPRARPTLLVSYERALRAPIAAGRAIAEFLRIDPAPDFDSWVSQYVAPDRLDGSIKASSARREAKDFCSSLAVQTLMEESRRVEREGFISGPETKVEDLVAAANMHYGSAVSCINNGKLTEAQDRALSILYLYSEELPSLLDGPIGILAEDLAGGTKIVYPDLVCGAFYLLGLSSLLRTSGQRALIYFSIAEKLMHRRLEQRLPHSVLSEANFWSCVFHKGMAAKAMQRQDIVDEVFRTIADAASELPPEHLARYGDDGLPEAFKRAMEEL